MDSFSIPSASGSGCLEFFERTPADVSRPIERFKVRLSDLELSAVARVYVEHTDASLAEIFSQMSTQWRGWEGIIAWDSAYGEMSLRCTQDRAGHVAIEVNLRSGSAPGDWSVRATIEAEAGQLEGIAQNAVRFFGSPECVYQIMET